MSNQSAEGTTGYNPRTGAYHVHHDWAGDESLAELVIYGVAAVTGLEPETVGPLGSSIDTDALEDLFTGDDLTEGHVSFVLQGCRIVANSDGDVRIHPP